MDSTAIVAAVKGQGGFDVTDVVALGWVNESYQMAVSQSGWYEQVVVLGTTVVGTSKYTLPDNVVEVRSIKVGGARYSLSASVEELWDLQNTDAQFHTGRGEDGVFAEGFDATTTRYVEIYPTPTVGGATISAYVTLSPPLLTLGDTPLVPVEFHNSIMIAGGIATGLERWSERFDLATPFWAKWSDAVEKLRRRANSRVGGARSQRAPLYGYEF